MKKPIVINNFSLVRKNSPVLYAENFFLRNFGGNVLTPGNYGSKFLDEDTSGFSNLDIFSGLEAMTEGSTRFVYGIDALTQIWISQALNAAGQRLLNIGGVNSYGDIKAMGTGVNSPILFTTKAKIGIISRGKATGGSGTTLVDSMRNFTAGEFAAVDGHTVLAAGDVVYNITQNKLFTIDNGGIVATTLTITAVSGGTFAANDYYAIINPDWVALSDSDDSYGRKIIEFDQDFYVLDGDAITKITSAFVCTINFKALEANWIGLCGASNGDTIVIGANNNNKGKLFFWDKNSNGWLKKISFDNEILAITRHDNNYIFVSGISVFITDGYNIRKLSEFPDSTPRIGVTVNPNGLLIIEDKLLINGGSNLPNRIRKGIHIFDISREEWTYSPYDPGTAIGQGRAGYNASNGILFFDSYINYIYYSFGNSGQGWTNDKILSTFLLGESLTQSAVIIGPISLGKDSKISHIDINVIGDLYEYNGGAQTVSLQLRLSSNKKSLWLYQQASATSSNLNEITVYGSSTALANAEVGDEIIIADGWNGFLRRTITAIANDGGDTELWTLDSNLPNLVQQNTTINVLSMKKYGMQNMTISQGGTYRFFPAFFGDNVTLEIYMLGTASKPTLSIKDIIIQTA